MRAQVHTALLDGRVPAAGFSNTWVKSAEVALPTLVVAVDDVTMAFAERLQALVGGDECVLIS